MAPSEYGQDGYSMIMAKAKAKTDYISGHVWMVMVGNAYTSPGSDISYRF
jgi:hypothetical protein